jgi:hypothetical protein
MTNFKTSNLILEQVPEFVRDEYPKFISFLEAYYEFLEEKQGSLNNDLISKAKSIGSISDVDLSLDDFESHFYEKFAALLPKEAEVRKDILFKNLNRLYLAKGSIESYKFLFRLLFNEEVQIIEPKNEVLRASSSVWSIENSLRIDPNELYLVHTGNGNKTTFLLPSSSFSVRTVLVNGVQTNDYLINRAYKKIIFNTAPANNAIIKIYFNDFDFSLFVNRKVIGKTSRASAIIERFAVSLISNRNIEDLYVNSKTLVGNFENGEYCITDVVVDGTLLNFEILTSSALRAINVVEGGSNYGNNDLVIISGGGAEQEAVAIIDEVFAGTADTITVQKIGAGFAVGSIIDTLDPPLAVNGTVSTVNTTGANVINTYTILSDTLIANVAGLTIDTADYGIPGKVISNTSKIVELMNPRTITVGGINSCLVISSNTVLNAVPIVDTQGAIFQTGSVSHSITSFKSVGGYQILNKGENYRIGDEVIFGPNPPLTGGVGAAARVSSVDVNGGIMKIAIEPTRIIGTVNVAANSHIITGTGTNFSTDLAVGDKISVNGEIKFINAITSSTEANVNSTFTYTTTNSDIALGRYNVYPIGGINYTQNNFPTLTIRSRNGVNANVIIDSCMGDGENITARGSKLPGAIVRIRILDGGKGYKYIPFINLTLSGDGKANAQAEIESSFTTFTGKWLTSDSIISSTERKIQGRDYYVDYSYVTSSRVEFRKYKQILKELLHPAGLVNYSRYQIEKTANVSDIDIISINPRKVISGRVNVGEGSIYLTGINTKFEDAYSKGYISLGDAISVNGIIYIVESIISNTNVEVSQTTTNVPGVTIATVPFTYTANLQPFTVLGEVDGISSGTAEILTVEGDVLITEDGLIITTE